MRLSLSIQMDVLKAKAGSILNTFKVLPRRDVLFFEDILAQYIRECEKAGYGREMYAIGKKSSALGLNLIPTYMRKLAPEYIPNMVIKKVWVNLGLLDDLKMVSSGNLHIFSTKNEFITRVIGKNNFMCGGFAGAAAGFYGKEAVCIESSQTNESCRYAIELLDKPFTSATKRLEDYKRLNEVPSAEGVSLKKALLSSFFQLADNRITFRGKTILCIENTTFHIIGSSGILLDRLASITTSFFEGLVEAGAPPEKKLSLLTALLQSCGWGGVAIEVKEGGRVAVYITHPPYGLQAEADNWNFLAYFMLGYLRIINKKIALDKIILRNGRLLFKYSGL